MKPKPNFRMVLLTLLILASGMLSAAWAQGSKESTSLDDKVRKFLDSHRGQWHDMNIPTSDGKLRLVTQLDNIVYDTRLRMTMPRGDACS